MEILISRRQIFFFLILAGSNPRVQFDKCIFWPRNRPPTAISRRSEKAVYPSPLTLPPRNVADGRLNYQNQFFDSPSEIISLLEHEWARPANYDLFR
jgi:hypothetical protein